MFFLWEVEMGGEVRCRNLHAAASLGAPIVAYSGLVCRLLEGDAAAAALMCQLWYLTREGARPVDETAEQLEESTGLSAKVQRRARRALAARGWISELRARRGGKVRIFTRVNAPVVLADLDAAGRQRPAEQIDLTGAQRAGDQVPNGQVKPPATPAQRAGSKNSDQDQEQEQEAADAAQPPAASRLISKEQQAKQPRPTEAEILSGVLDDTPAAAALAVCAVICAAMDREWHGGQRKVVPGKQSQALLVDHVRAGGRASDVLKAVHGMRHDDWSDRGRFAQLRHVFGKLPEWVRLYEERHLKGDRPVWPRAQHRVPAGFRPWRGVLLPADREPTNGDQLALEAGYVFTFDGRQWVDPADDPLELVAAHRARYGDANVTPTARARIAAVEARRARG